MGAAYLHAQSCIGEPLGEQSFRAIHLYLWLFESRVEGQRYSTEPAASDFNEFGVNPIVSDGRSYEYNGRNHRYDSRIVGHFCAEPMMRLLIETPCSNETGWPLRWSL